MSNSSAEPRSTRAEPCVCGNPDPRDETCVCDTPSWVWCPACEVGTAPPGFACTQYGCRELDDEERELDRRLRAKEPDALAAEVIKEERWRIVDTANPDDWVNRRVPNLIRRPDLYARVIEAARAHVAVGTFDEVERTPDPDDEGYEEAQERINLYEHRWSDFWDARLRWLLASLEEGRAAVAEMQTAEEERLRAMPIEERIAELEEEAASKEWLARAFERDQNPGMVRAARELAEQLRGEAAGLRAVWVATSGPSVVPTRERDEGKDDEEPEPERPAWPELPERALNYGLAGEIVWTVDPYTEADPVAVLIHLLIAFGNAVDRGPRMRRGAERHGANLFAVLVGDTAKARKGSSWSPVRQLLEAAEPEWAATRIMGGLSSGEGLIHEVRDRREHEEEVKPAKGRLEQAQARLTGSRPDVVTVVDDPGVNDKRLLVIEPEFARVLKVISGRDGNTLSTVVRHAWDGGTLRSMTRKSGLIATDAHIAIVGHITAEELRRELNATEAANGFANRFLWALVRRSKELAHPAPFEGAGLTGLIHALHLALARARAIERVEFDGEARERWTAEYHDLSAARRGMLGSMSARAEAQVVRLALIYALMDQSPVIRLAHLEAGLDVWGYCARSLELLFGEATGDPIADSLAQVLKQRREMSREEVNRFLAGHARPERIDAARRALEERGWIEVERRATGGRPAEVWRWRRG